MTNQTFRYAIISGATLLIYGCSSTPKQVNTAFRVRCNVDHALVTYSPETVFKATNSVVLGTTPMIRLKEVPGEGARLQVTARGYHPWEGALLPTTNVLVVPCQDSTNRLSLAAITNLNVVLQPLTAEEKQNRGWVESPPCAQVALLPVKVGTQVIGGSFISDPNGPFEREVSTVLRYELEKRLGAVFQSTAVSTTFTNHAGLLQALDEVDKRVPDYMYLKATPDPVTVNVPDDVKRKMRDIGGGILLFKANALYLSTTANALRVGVPLALTVLSAAAGAGGASASGSSYYTYNVYSIAPKSDMIIVQGYLVHSQTCELLWLGQMAVPGSFKKGNATCQAASGVARQLPRGLVGQSAGPQKKEEVSTKD